MEPPVHLKSQNLWFVFVKQIFHKLMALIYDVVENEIIS